MKNDEFYIKFISAFENKFQSTVDDIFAASLDTSFEDSLIKTFKEPLTPYISGGKRIRPFLIAVGAGSLHDTVIDAGIAFELIHTFALVHDDLMDGASMRRNVPTVHTFFKSKGFDGPAGAILLGDFILVAANEYLSQKAPDLLPVFMKMQRFLCIGQFYEMTYWGRDVRPEISQKIARFKSAQYSFMYPLQHGLQIASKEIHQLDDYADNTGLAFQMRDDWLDITDEIESGKDKNLDDINSVPNRVQKIFQTHNRDIDSTKKEVEQELLKYKTAAIHSLESVTLSEKQHNSLLGMLEFSTTI